MMLQVNTFHCNLGRYLFQNHWIFIWNFYLNDSLCIFLSPFYLLFRFLFAINNPTPMRELQKFTHFTLVVRFSTFRENKRFWDGTNKNCVFFNICDLEEEIFAISMKKLSAPLPPLLLTIYFWKLEVV